MAANKVEYYETIHISDGVVAYLTSDGLLCRCIHELEHTDAVAKLEREFRELCPREEYRKSAVWRLVFRFMDSAPVVWLVLQFWLGLVILPFYMDRLLTKEHGMALSFLLFVGVNAVRDWFTVLIFFWPTSRNSLLLLLSDTAPPEAEILLLEWKRNRSRFHTFEPWVEQAMWIKVIEKARSGGYSVNMDPTQLAEDPDTPLIQGRHDKDLELQKITGQLRSLLLSKASVDTQEQESHWQYDHSLWKYKDAWPEGVSSVIFLLCDLHFSTLGACLRVGSWYLLVFLTGFVYLSRDEKNLPNTTLTFEEIHQWTSFFLFLVVLSSWAPWFVIKKHCF